MNKYQGAYHHYEGNVTYNDDVRYYSFSDYVDYKSLDLTADISITSVKSEYVVLVIVVYSYEHKKYGKERRYSLDMSVHYSK